MALHAYGILVWIGVAAGGAWGTAGGVTIVLSYARGAAGGTLSAAHANRVLVCADADLRGAPR
eukprot:SAG11_NODE_36701_length_260_cov_0.913043_1_plen_62_part_10